MAKATPRSTARTSLGRSSPRWPPSGLDLPAPEPLTTQVDCSVTGTFAVPTSSLAAPVAATRCPLGKGEERRLRPAVIAELFGSATHGGPACDAVVDAAYNVVTVDAYGDTIRWAPDGCGDLVSLSGGRTPDETWHVPLGELPG